MADFYINTKKVSIDGLSLETIEDLMNHTSEQLDKNDVITGIYLNDRFIPEENEEKFLKDPISDYEKVQIRFMDKMELAYEALENSHNYVDVLVDKVKKVSNLYKENEVQQASKLFSEAIEILDLFVQLIANVRSILRVKANENENSTKIFHDLEMHLLTLCKALFTARENGDIIMLCDLLEYELVDNLTQWKTTAIPELKKLKTN